MKPNSAHCKMWCKDVATCNRTSCARTPLFIHGITTVMAEPSLTDPITKRIKKRLYTEDILKIKGFNV